MDDKMIEDRAKEIFETAQGHAGNFHLPQHGAESDSDACRLLVSRGLARWLIRGPGIALTGQPWPPPTPQPEPMSLDLALSILVRTHTRDDDDIGFTVEMGASPRPWESQGDYVRAWQAVRSHLGLPT